MYSITRFVPAIRLIDQPQGNGEAFGLSDGSTATVLDLLLAVNARSSNGRLYDLDADGDATDSLETLYRTAANDVFSAINELGDGP